MTKIVYIGNDLAGKTRYRTSHEIVTDLLRKSGYEVISVSDKKNKLLRMADMLYTVVRHWNAQYFLIDTYSTQNFYYALIISQFLRLGNKKYIPILHGGNLPERLEKNPLLSRMIFARAYRNVAPSPYLLRIFRKAGFGVEFIPNTLVLDRYLFKERKQFRPRLLWVRAFARHYRPCNAVKVLHRLKKQYPDTRLCMVGPDKDGSMEDARCLAEKLNVKNDVIFTGALEQSEWHRLSEDYDIFINTTDVDNTPVSVMEAMALGLPVVSTRAGGLPDLIQHEHDGLLVDLNNPEAMAEAVVHYVENPGLAGKIAANARRKVEQFDGKKVLLQWKNILK